MQYKNKFVKRVVGILYWFKFIICLLFNKQFSHKNKNSNIAYERKIILVCSRKSKDKENELTWCCLCVGKGLFKNWVSGHFITYSPKQCKLFGEYFPQYAKQLLLIY